MLLPPPVAAPPPIPGAVPFGCSVFGAVRLEFALFDIVALPEFVFMLPFPGIGLLGA
jgi:hypothetical protein